MTIARDIHTGQVVGQVTDPRGRTFVGSAYIRLLTRDGKYLTVDPSTVRLEKVS